MDSNDISAILPSQDNQEEHYLGTTASKNEQIIGQEPDYIYESVLMPTIYFAKKTMKDLLEDRTVAFQKLNLKMKNTKLSEQQKEWRKNDEQLIMHNIARIFKECPSSFDTVTVVHIHDCQAIYSFFSSDGRYIPLCKKCNATTYLLTRFPTIKIYCCNPKCKLKIIGEDTILQANGLRALSRQQTSSSRQQTEKSQLSQGSEGSKKSKRFYSKHELEMIKKTAQKIYQN